MKYKLLKDLPDVKAGTVIQADMLYSRFTQNTVNNSPEWFAPYVETTHDGIDMFAGDFGAVLHIKSYHSEKNTIKGHTFIGKVNPEYVLTFSTKEKAQEYLKKANDEIIKYYEQKGWVEGAKFKFENKIYTLHRIVKDHEYPMCGSIIKGICCLLEDYLDNFQVMLIEECELVKEPQYPKSWEELEGVVGCYISVNSEICEGSHKYSPILGNINLFSNKKQAESALAFAQLSQLHKAMIDEYNKINNCDWKPKWSNTELQKWCIIRISNFIHISWYCDVFKPLSFPTKEMAEFSLENHRELWKQYYQL